MCCSMTQLSVDFIRTSARAMSRSLRGQGCGNCCPGSGLFGTQSSGAIVAETGSSIVALQTPCPEPDSSAGSEKWYCSHRHFNTTRNTTAETNNPKIPEMTKVFSCCNSHACVQTAVRTMMLVR